LYICIDQSFPTLILRLFPQDKILKIKEEIENVTKIGNMVVWRVTMQMLTHNDQELLNEYSIETTLSDFSTLYLSKKKIQKDKPKYRFSMQEYIPKNQETDKNELPEFRFSLHHQEFIPSNQETDKNELPKYRFSLQKEFKPKNEYV